MAVLLQNHGLVVAGYTLRRAVDMTKIIEQTAMQILGCLAAGKKPPVLPDDIVDGDIVSKSAQTRIRKSLHMIDTS